MTPRALPWLVLAAAVALGWRLGGHRLLDPDEGRNAEVAREMARSGDYLLPHLDGLPYLDKPVVYFAAAAAAMNVLGPNETAARLPAYLATLATLGLVAWFARRRWGADAGWLAALALATMPMPLAYARAAIFDSTLSLCTTAAILCFFEERPVLAWVAMGVGALTKGPVALLVPLATILPWALQAPSTCKPERGTWLPSSTHSRPAHPGRILFSYLPLTKEAELLTTLRRWQCPARMAFRPRT